MSAPSYHEKLAEIAEVAEKVCNDWEIGFVESLLERGPELEWTDKQKDVIDRIYKKVCDSPY